MDILSIDLKNINLDDNNLDKMILNHDKMILKLSFTSDVWLGILNLKNVNA